MKLFTLLLLVCLISSSCVLADNIYVTTTPGDNPDGKQDNPYGSFQAAIDSGLTSGDHILAYPGEYKGENNQNIVVDPSLALAFRIAGTGEVIIDFEGSNNAFLTVASPALPFAIEGYKFQNQEQNADTAVPILSFTGTEETLVAGCIFSNVGFAISMIDVTDMRIEGGTFDGCVNTEQNGPALFTQDSLGVVAETLFQNCHGSKGGAVYLDATPDGYITMQSVQILNNKAEKYGGGLYLNQHVNLSIIDSAVRNNEAIDHNGGGIYAEAPLTITGTDIEYNTAGDNGGGLSLETTPSSSSYVAHYTLLSQLGVNGNIATLGAGLHLNSLSPVYITASSMSRNTAQSDDTEEEDAGLGGAIYVNTSSDAVTIDDTTLSYNHADERGGGMYIAGESKSTLVQMRAGCHLENNYATRSGGGVELAGPILFASFTSSTFVNNEVNAQSGTGGALQISGSSIVSQCTIHSNTAHDGAGVHISQAGIVTVTDSSVAINNASYGGGIHISSASGVFVKGGDISDNIAIQGGGAYIAPSLPVEFSDVAFQTNTAKSAGSSIYLSGVSQSTVNGLNLVKVKDCDFIDESDEGIYSNAGEIVFFGVCSIPGIQTVADSSVAVCGCQTDSVVITNLLLQASSGTFVSDSPIQVTTRMDWYGGDLYGVNSTTCVNGIKTGFNYSSSTSMTLTLLGAANIAASDDTLYSTDVHWVIEDNASLNVAAFEMDAGVDSTITIMEGGRLTMPDGKTLRCGSLYNAGLLQMQKECTIDAEVFESGTLSVEYNSPQVDKKELAYIRDETINSGATLLATVPATPKLQEGDEFYLLKWGANQGHFKTFTLKSELADKTHGVLFYKSETLECVIEHGDSDSSGGLIAVIIVSVVVVLAFIIGTWWALKNRGKMSWDNEQEVWDDAGPAPIPSVAEEQRVLGESGSLVEGREEQSLIGNNEL